MRSPVFKHTSNPAIDRPDYYVSKSSKRSMIRLGKAEELDNGSLLLKPPFNPLAPEKKVFHDGTGGGWWNTKRSAGFAVKQFDRTEWPIATAKETPQTNGWPNRMTNQHQDSA